MQTQDCNARMVASFLSAAEWEKALNVANNEPKYWLHEGEGRIQRQYRTNRQIV